jgi:hypothetical protein
MCVRCGTGGIAWCTDPLRHGDSAEPVQPGQPPAETELGGLLAAKRLETQPVWDAAGGIAWRADLLAFVTELAGMSTDAERQEDAEGGPDPEVREGDTEILDNLITRARTITGAVA